MFPFEGLQAVLPGRLKDLVLEQVIIDHGTNYALVIFHFSLFDDFGEYITGAVSQYDLHSRLWDVIFDSANFKRVPVSDSGQPSDMDAIRAIQKVLVEWDSKKAGCIKELKRMRRLLNIQPVKVITLKK